MGLMEKFEATLQKYGLIKMAEEQPVEEVKPTGNTESMKNEGNLIKKITWTATDEPVLADGEKVQDGIYTLDNGIKLTIIKGVLAEVQTIEEKKEENVEEVEEVPSEEKKEDMPMSGDTKVEMAQNVEKQRIQDIIDMTKDGEYTISLTVSNGVITWGNLYTNTYQNLLMAEQEKIESKLTELTQSFDLKLAEHEKKVQEQQNIIDALKSAKPQPKKVEMAFDGEMSPLKADVLQKKRERGLI